MRESVIKQSRDIQKLSKQAIFSLHGGKTADAQSKLSQASQIAKDVLPLIVEQPCLRSGSYSNSLEEWAEGQLLFHWMDDKTIPGRVVLGEHVGQVNVAY
jgi:predicted translin family RNA/ssDNA-binding protein